MAEIRVDQPFRNPDVSEDGYYVWYGPGGRKGEHATETETGSRGWDVSEYAYVVGLITDPEDDFLKTSTFVEKKELWKAIARAGVVITDRQIEDPTPAEELMLARWATAYGVEKLAYWGGDEEFVDSLP